MDGQTVINHDILYLPQVIAGSPLSQTKSYGFFAVTLTHAIFIPALVHKTEKSDILSSRFDITQAEIQEYGGIPFWDVVENRAMGLTPIELSEYLYQMAKSIEGSLLVDLSNVTDIKISLLSIKVEAGEESYSVGIGIKSQNRNIARAYLGQNFSFAGIGVPKHQLGIGTQLAFISCLFLVLAVGMMNVNKAPSSELLVQKALSDLDKSSSTVS